MNCFGTHYIKWRENRFKTIVDHYPEGFFEGKTLLELGAGYSDLGAMFADIGAKVTCAEGRNTHVAVAQQRYPNKDMKFMCVDLDTEWPFEQFDVILHLGLLYHLSSPDATLVKSCQTAQHIILETEVCDSLDPHLNIKQSEQGYDQSLNGWGCHPSPAYIERVLTEYGAKFEMLQSDSANAHLHNYDWEVKNNGGIDCGQRRMWFVEVTK